MLYVTSIYKKMWCQLMLNWWVLALTFVLLVPTLLLSVYFHGGTSYYSLDKAKIVDVVNIMFVFFNMVYLIPVITFLRTSNFGEMFFVGRTNVKNYFFVSSMAAIVSILVIGLISLCVISSLTLFSMMYLLFVSTMSVWVYLSAYIFQLLKVPTGFDGMMASGVALFMMNYLYSIYSYSKILAFSLSVLGIVMYVLTPHLKHADRFVEADKFTTSIFPNNSLWYFK